MSVSDQIDKLINFNFGYHTGLEKLHLSLKKTRKQSPVSDAADALMRLKKGEKVFIVTGSPTRSWISPSIGENDGPIGAVVLSGALFKAFHILPVIITDALLIEATKSLVRGVGYTGGNIEEGLKAIESTSPLGMIALHDFPTNNRLARNAAAELIKRLKPSFLISVERSGRNEKGEYHNMKGINYSKDRARMDYLFTEARSKGISTIGIGDGGNEIGMGVIKEAVRKFIPYGKECQCPCKGGIACVTETDILVTAAVSNWGCYGIISALAIKLRNPQILHNGNREKALIYKSIDAGFVDGVTGMAEPTVDGMPFEIHSGIVEILKFMALREIER